MKMTVFFKWLDEYSLGLPKIDEQHQYMFRLANEIQYSEPSEAEQYARKLYNYTKWHFSDEEKYFSRIESPLLTEHMKLHNGLIKGLDAVIKSGLSTNDDVEKLKTFFLKWLVDHILYQDRKVIKFGSSPK
jgi:hemerythrin